MTSATCVFVVRVGRHCLENDGIRQRPLLKKTVRIPNVVETDEIFMVNVNTIRFGPFNRDPDRYFFRITKMNEYLIYLIDVNYFLKNLMRVKFVHRITMDTFLCFLCIGIFEEDALKKNFPSLVYILLQETYVFDGRNLEDTLNVFSSSSDI